jgi:CubicO group peptidase (beta-lactamase class C family)
MAGQTQAEEVAPAPLRGPTDPIELEAFLDGLISAYRQDHNIAGLTVSVVRDGELFFSKGFGWADVEERAPVEAATTLFRIGSISKLFTWTAVMQQVEEGNLDLDTDVNEYIDFEIPDTYPEPITLRHILTHTPGFEDRAWGLFSETDLSRGEWLAENLPARVRPPGTYSSYSNYATSLAGYIVGRVSGMSWEDYIEARIMEPLGMVYATGKQPLPDHLAPHMSNGYVYEAGKYVEKDFEMIDGSAPAGSVSASADAMAKFMIAHLQYGQLGDARILQEETAREMYSREFTHDDRLNGFALGFYEKSGYGLQAIGHGGDTGWFHSDMALFHSENLGIFMSTNTAGGGNVSFGPFLEAVLAHYYPTPPFEPPTPPDNWEEQGQKYAGSYLFNRRSFTTFEKVASLMGGAVKVEAGEAGELLAETPFGAIRMYWAEPGLFRMLEGSWVVAFEEDDDGEVTRMFLGPAPMMAGDKLSFWGGAIFHQLVMGFCLFLFASVLVLMPIRFLTQKTVDGIEPLKGRERSYRWLALLLAVLNLGFLVALGTAAGNTTAVLEGNTGPLKTALVLPMIGVLVTIGVVLAAVQAWRGGLWGRWGRIHYGLLALAAVIFLLELNYFNLLGWKI